MIHEQRKKKVPLHEIAKKITDECQTNWYCKDNVTLMLVDLRKYYKEFKKASQQKRPAFYDDMAFHPYSSQLEGHPL